MDRTDERMLAFASEFRFTAKRIHEAKAITLSRRTNHGDAWPDGQWCAVIYAGGLNPWYLGRDGVWRYKVAGLWPSARESYTSSSWPGGRRRWLRASWPGGRRRYEGRVTNMRANNHPPAAPRGKRDPATCKVQTGGKLVFIISIPGIYTEQPMFWTNRPCKFAGHIRRMLARPGTVITDIKWRQLNGRVWWRIPDWPDGEARS